MGVACAEGPHMAVAAGAELPQRPVLMMAELDLVRIDLPQAQAHACPLSNTRKVTASKRKSYHL